MLNISFYSGKIKKLSKKEISHYILEVGIKIFVSISCSSMHINCTIQWISGLVSPLLLKTLYQKPRPFLIFIGRWGEMALTGVKVSQKLNRFQLIELWAQCQPTAEVFYAKCWKHLGFVGKLSLLVQRKCLMDIGPHALVGVNWFDQ